MKNLVSLFSFLVEPSNKDLNADERQKAVMLASIILVLLVVVVLSMILIILLINDPALQQLSPMPLATGLLMILYLISRTRYQLLTAILLVAVTAFLIFKFAYSNPETIFGGILDFLLIPLLLASLYFSRRWFIGAIVVINAIVLATPLMQPAVSMDYTLSGPFSFVFCMSLLTWVFSEQRNRMEQTRLSMLRESEKLAEAEARRANLLLNVAGKLIRVSDVERLPMEICRGVSESLGTPYVFFAEYSVENDTFKPTAWLGADVVGFEPTGEFARKELDLFSSNLTNNTFNVKVIEDQLTESRKQQYQNAGIQEEMFAYVKYMDALLGLIWVIRVQGTANFTSDDYATLQGVADQAALAFVNQESLRIARQRLENIQALRQIDLAITSSSLENVLDEIVEVVTRSLSVDACVLFSYDAPSRSFSYSASEGFLSHDIRSAVFHMDDSLAGRALQRQEVVHISEVDNPSTGFQLVDAISDEGFSEGYILPIIVKDRPLGVLEVFDRKKVDRNAEWLDFLETLTGQVGIAIDGLLLLSDLETSNRELMRAYEKTIEGWSYALDLRDEETEGHTQRVTAFTLELAREFHLPEEQLVHIRRGALLHDIGKMGIPDSILLKPGPLDDDEWVRMRQHTMYARSMLEPIEYLQPALDIPYSHHEKWDGSGYPLGLSGEAIPLPARIFAVVDVWDALTSERPYRAAWTRERALSYIREQSGKHFDPAVVEKFLAIIASGD